MTDTEYTVLSARAVGYGCYVGNEGVVWATDPGQHYGQRMPTPWRPLTDWAQAVRIADKLKLHMKPAHPNWEVTPDPAFKYAVERDLRRAIVVCAAKIQLARS